MRYDKIDIQKSIDKNKVIRKTWLLVKIIDFFGSVVLVCSFTFLSGLVLTFKIKSSEDLVEPIMIFFIPLIFGELLCYSLLKLDRLKRIKGVSKEQNREIIKGLFENLGWTIFNHNQKMTLAVPPWSWCSTNWGQQVIVIYDHNDILINCTTYGLHDIKSPFHWFGNRKRERKIIIGFEKQNESQ